MSELKSLFIGKVKDKASIVKTKFLHTFTSKPIKNIHLALLKSTTHTSHKPPNSNYVSDIISYSNSRYDPTAFAAVMWRLRGTNNAFVANKSLIVLHKLIRSSRDKFDGLDDQSWNNLKLKEFWDKSSSLAQELSQWVRWYGLYLDHLSWIWKLLGSFPNLNLLKSSKDKTQETERVLSYQTEYIMRQLDFLVSFFEHICTRPETPVMFENKIVDEIRELVIQDYFTVMILIVVRLQVLSERSIKQEDDSGLNDLNLVLVRLEECKESLSGFFWRYRRLGEDFWCMVEMLKGEMVKENMEMVEFAGLVKDDDEMVELPGLVQTEWVTFDDTEMGTGEMVKMDSEWVTFDDHSNGLTNESVWFSRQEVRGSCGPLHA